jgi:hypothetical protein
MTGKPFLRKQLGNAAAIVDEIAPGADLSDADGSGWTWVDISGDVRHADGTSTTIGRADNVGTTPAAQFAAGLNNPNGDYSPLAPNGAHYPNITRNMPVRRRMTLDGVTWHTRFQGYLQSLVPGSDLSGKVSTVALGAAGMLARVAGRRRPLKTPLYRAMSTLPNLLAYWPMEDGTDAVSFAPAVAGGKPLTKAGTTAATFAKDGPAGSLPLPNFTVVDQLAGVPYRAAVSYPTPASAGICISFVAKLTLLDAAGTYPAPLISFTAGGNRYQIQYLNNSPPPLPNLFITTINSGAPFGTGDFNDLATGADGEYHLYQVALLESGGIISVSLFCDGQPDPSGFAYMQPLTTASLGTLTDITVGPASQDDPNHLWGYNLGHVAISAVATLATAPGADLASAVSGYTGETADARLTRLAGEENIALDLTGTSDVTMGAQPVATLLAILQECEAADHGILYDGLGPGLGYVCRESVYDLAAAYILDMSVQHVTDPATGYLDMQGITNIVAASRPNGSTVTVERTDGSSGTDAIGDEDTTWTGNVESDDVLPFHAAFVAALGSPDGQRIPQISPNVRILSGATLGSLLAAGPRHRLDVTNPPRRELGPDTLALLVEGWRETTTADHWALVLNTSPYAPYDVAVVDGADRRVAADGTATLAGGLTTTQVGARTVNVTQLWSTDPADYPSNVIIGGEEITLSGVSGAASPQTFTISVRSVNGVVKAHNTGDQVEVAQPAIVAL